MRHGKVVKSVSYSAEHETQLKDLVTASSRVLKAFRKGRSPTFDQLDKLEAVLTPFTTEKLCGHGMLEECSCFE